MRMLKEITELLLSAAKLNSDGLKILISVAKDMTSHDKYRRSEGGITHEELIAGFEKSTAMSRSWREGCTV